MERISRDKFYMSLAETYSLRSNCISRKVGCIIVKNDKPVSFGYNGTPRNTPNCAENGCKRCNSNLSPGESLNTCRCLHAELNALLFGDYEILQGSLLYCTLSPCLACCNAIIQCGIKVVYYKQNYTESDQANIEYLQTSGVIVKQIL